MEVIKGTVAPLTAAQRELVAIFIEHLRNLPPLNSENWEESCRRPQWGRATTTYRPIYDLLLAFFDRRAATVLPYSGDELWKRLDGPEKDKFHNLMENASSPTDPQIERRRALLNVARSKRCALEFIRYYERDRREAGLGPDPELKTIRGPVGLEVATQVTWGDPA